MNKRFLPLIREDGNWIQRPDLFLLARMSYADVTVRKIVADQLYRMLISADNTSAILNVLEFTVEELEVQRNLRPRLFAGSTVLELVRIAATTGRSPSVNQAISLVAFNKGLQEKGKAQPDSLKRQVRKGFSDYRNTAHLQAAMILGSPGIDEIETSEFQTKAFLSRARGLELFLDANVVSKDLKWHPWRVPPEIEPNFDVIVRKLSAAECAAAGIDI